MKLPVMITGLFILLMGFYACDPNKGAAFQVHRPDTEVDPNEEYVMITTIVNYPMYVNHDQKAFGQWGNSRGVKTTVLGPSEWDVQAQLATIEQVIGTQPTGLLINGTDPAIASAINLAVDAGIPTVVYDSDIPSSQRHAFIGTDWRDMGILQAKKMVALTGGKGKIAYLGLLGLTNMEDGYRGMMEVFKNYPDIELVGKYNDEANIEVSSRLAADLISAHPDMAGFCTFTPMSGMGVGTLLRETGNEGDIFLTSVNYEPELLQLMEEGVIQLLACQKRELFTWYGAQLLFDMVHKTHRLSAQDDKAGVTAVPRHINTGTFAVNPQNLPYFKN